MDDKPSFQKLTWVKNEINELESYLQNLEMDFQTKSRLLRILSSLKQERDNIRNAIAEAHINSAYKFARRYHHDNLDFEDFYQEAIQALLKATDSYDPSFGVPFEAYAYIWIRKTLSHMVESHAGPVRIPDSVIRANRKAKVPVHNCSYEPYEDTYKLDEPNAEEIHICRETKRFLTCCIDDLDDTRRKILLKRYFTNKLMPLEDVAKECGISREQTRLLEKSTLQDLKKRIYSSKITSYRRTIH